MTGYFYRIKKDKVQTRIGTTKGSIEWSSSEGIFNGGRFCLPTDIYLGFKDLIDYKRTKEPLYIKLDMSGKKFIRKNYEQRLKKVSENEFNL